jgi:transcription initiation factor TFIID subunit 6
VNKTLIHAFLDPAKPLPTHYGGIRALTELGANTVELLVIPNVVAYMTALQADLQSDDRERKRDAEKVRAALLVTKEDDSHRTFFLSFSSLSL